MKYLSERHAYRSFVRWRDMISPPPSRTLLSTPLNLIIMSIIFATIGKVLHASLAPPLPIEDKDIRPDIRHFNIQYQARH